jgi:hypothetical protein
MMLSVPPCRDAEPIGPFRLGLVDTLRFVVRG